MARVTDRQIEEAIVASGGVVADAARMLGISRKTFYARLKRQPRLQQLLDDEREAFIDLAESELRKLVKAGHPAAVFFTLKTIGNRRGWIENYRAEHTGAGGGAIEHRIVIERVEGRGG